MGQSQTKGGVGNILAAIDELKLQTWICSLMPLSWARTRMGYRSPLCRTAEEVAYDWQPRGLP